MGNNIKAGDCVASNITNMIGHIVKLLNDNDAVVSVDDKEIIVNLNYWHKVDI